MRVRKTIGKMIPSCLSHFTFNTFGHLFYWIDLYSVHSNKNKPATSTTERDEMFIVSIAYNNDQLISKQIEMIKKHVKDPHYKLLIVDNSTNNATRKNIQDVCSCNQIEYFPIPFTFRQKACKMLKWNGMSHGLALNWTFYHVLYNKRPKYFTLLDHDIFPVKDCNLTERFGGLQFFGVRRERGNYWYLWPGWAIFNFDAIVEKNPNFQPYFTKKTYLDSGGGNYFKIYHNYAINTIPFPNVKTHRLKKTKGLSTWNDVYHSDCIQFIDDCWLHVINGSNYCHFAGKDDTVKKILNNIHLFEEE
jgi:hypothetical protein